MKMLENIKAKAVIARDADTGRVVASLMAIMLGSFIFFGAGFAPMTNVHNATHDTRHAFSMPCH
jgi:cobalt transporter subunit CbtB